MSIRRPGPLNLPAVILAASLPLAGCSSDREAAARLANEPAFDCAVEMKAPLGVVSAIRTLNASGKQLSVTAQWDGRGEPTGPRLLAFWWGTRAPEVDLASGRVDIVWHLWKYRGRHSVTQRLRLELGAADDGKGIFQLPLVGRYERSAGPFDLAASWHDIATRAEGSARLKLSARDVKGGVVNQVDIGPLNLSDVASAVRQALDDTADMARDPHARCVEHLNDVVVT